MLEPQSAIVLRIPVFETCILTRDDIAGQPVPRRVWAGHTHVTPSCYSKSIRIRAFFIRAEAYEKRGEQDFAEQDRAEAAALRYRHYRE
jgi:hypothetical protein